jgi:hypothetical protein
MTCFILNKKFGSTQLFIYAPKMDEYLVHKIFWSDLQNSFRYLISTCK